MLQIRVSLPDFSSGISFTDPIILENADSITLSKELNSENESISFSMPPNDPKVASGISYLRWWECWDTETNTRLNYGPIDEISYTTGEAIQVRGAGRSSILKDFYKDVQTFYTPIDQFIDDLRYENMINNPRVSTIINKDTDSEYYGLSDRTKDFAIDTQTGFISIGRDTPERGTLKTSDFWSGTGKSDYLIVDLGEPYYISKSKVLLPWWGGATQNNNRAYDWSWKYSNDNSSYTQAFITASGNHYITEPPDGLTLYFGESGFEQVQETPVSGGPLQARYWKLDITDTYAWYGNAFLGSLSDEWDWECNETNIFNGNTLPSPTASGGIIPKISLSPASDCHAAAVELGLFRKILSKDTISNNVYHQIQSDNRQITFFHAPTAGEMLAGGKKFEPGSLFRKISITGSGLTVKDPYNNVIYTSAAGELDLPAYTRYVTFSSPTQVSTVDAWPSKVDAFSYEGEYSYTTVTNDYAILDFRGTSVKWYATVPSTELGATVRIDLREKQNSSWSAWTTLENNFVIGSGIAGKKVWEITPESGDLSDNTSYQLKITNLGGYCSIDAFAGYWAATYSEYNEDDAKLKSYIPTDAAQNYDETDSQGSIYEYTGGTFTKISLKFEGDRAIVYSKKGPGYGEITIGLVKRSTNGAVAAVEKVNIPNTVDGTLTVDLNNSEVIPQVVIFDSADYFNDDTGTILPWGVYTVGIYRPTDQGSKPIYVDGIGAHETTGVTVKFLTTTYLDILKSTAEAFQLEWDVTESGLKVVPRIGTDTDVIFSEGQGTTIKIDNTEDNRNIASTLITTGGDIDGLPLTFIGEDKTTRKLLGRTVTRLYDDLRNSTDYFTLGVNTRVELIKRRDPERRITVERSADIQGLEVGDSFLINTSAFSGRVRLIAISQSQSSSGGTSWTLECERWPRID